MVLSLWCHTHKQMNRCHQPPLVDQPGRLAPGGGAASTDAFTRSSPLWGCLEETTASGIMYFWNAVATLTALHQARLYFKPRILFLCIRDDICVICKCHCAHWPWAPLVDWLIDWGGTESQALKQSKSTANGKELSLRRLPLSVTQKQTSVKWHWQLIMQYFEVFPEVLNYCVQKKRKFLFLDFSKELLSNCFEPRRKILFICGPPGHMADVCFQRVWSPRCDQEAAASVVSGSMTWADTKAETQNLPIANCSDQWTNYSAVPCCSNFSS